MPAAQISVEKTNASKHKPVIAQVMTHNKKKKIRYTRWIMIHNIRDHRVIIKHMVVLNRLYYDHDKLETNICSLPLPNRMLYTFLRRNVKIIIFCIKSTLHSSLVLHCKHGNIKNTHSFS